MSSCASPSASRKRRRMKKHDKPKLWIFFLHIFLSYFLPFSLFSLIHKIIFRFLCCLVRQKGEEQLMKILTWSEISLIREKFSCTLLFSAIEKVSFYFLLKFTFPFIEENRSPLELHVLTLGRLNEN